MSLLQLPHVSCVPHLSIPVDLKLQTSRPDPSAHQTPCEPTEQVPYPPWVTGSMESQVQSGEGVGVTLVCLPLRLPTR